MAQIRASSLAGFFVTALVLATFPLTPTTARAAGGFITTSGSSFVLSGQEIRLRGLNMNNEQALGAAIGSGNLSDITIGAEDYNRVAGWGINLVRFGLSFTWYQTDRNAFFQSLDGQVAAAHAAGVYLIPVMFTTPADCYEGYGHTCGIWSSGAEQQRLLSFWQDFARHYAGETAIAGYDLLNEPAPPNVSQWLSLAQSIRDAVVAVDANHDVVIEAGSDSLFSGLLGARVIYSVHGYAPLSMTTGATPGRYSYPGNAPDWDGTSRYWSYQSMTDPTSAVYMGWRESFDWAQASKVPIFYGEFGTQPFGNGWVQYVSEQIDLAERWGAAWALFNYHEPSYGDFGIYYGPESARVGDPNVSVKQDLLTMLTTKLAQLGGRTISWQYTAMYAWYDRISSPGFLADDIHVINPNSTAASISLTIPGQPGCSFLDQLGAGEDRHYGCPTGYGGPVVLQASERVNSSQRVQYYRSFNEVLALPVTSAATKFFMPWYDHSSSPGFLNDNVHVVNPSSASAQVNVTIPGCGDQSATIPPGGGESIFACGSGYGGPVVVTSTNGVPVLATQRVQYYGSFNEVVAHPAQAAGVSLYFPWYDRISNPGFLADNVHVMNPGSTDAQVTVSIPGCGGQSWLVPALATHFFNCDSGYGGPVSVASTNGVPVLASQRVLYYQSFNEVAAQSPGAAAALLYMPWFDRISSPGFLGDNVHVVNPGSGEAQVAVGIPGCGSQVVAVAPGGEHIFTCASGFGGPVTVATPAGTAVLASQRVQYYSSFNESGAEP